MTASQEETKEALERLNGDYIYFHPKEYLIKREVARKNRPLHCKVRRAFTAIFSKEPIKVADGTLELDVIQKLQSDSQFGKHAAERDKLSDDDWHRLLCVGYFRSDSPYMRLYLHDVRIKEAYEAAKQSQEKNNLKHQKADDRARNLNRRVGKRRMTR